MQRVTALHHFVANRYADFVKEIVDDGGVFMIVNNEGEVVFLCNYVCICEMCTVCAFWTDVCVRVCVYVCV